MQRIYTSFKEGQQKPGLAEGNIQRPGQTATNLGFLLFPPPCLPPLHTIGLHLPYVFTLLSPPPPSYALHSLFFSPVSHTSYSPTPSLPSPRKLQVLQFHTQPFPHKLQGNTLFCRRLIWNEDKAKHNVLLGKLEAMATREK